MSNPFFIFATLCLSISLNVIGKSAKPDIVELRWILPADAWDLHEGYTFKGKAFRISERVNGNKFWGNELGIRMYLSPNLTGKYIIVNQGSMFNTATNRSECSKNHRVDSDFNVDKIRICQSTCKQLTTSEKKSLKENSQLGSVTGLKFFKEILTKKTFESCPVPLNAFYLYYQSQEPELDSVNNALKLSEEYLDLNYYFITKSTDFKKGYIEVEANNKIYYLDARVCLARPEHCKFVDIKESQYEKDLAIMKKHQEKKDLLVLNILLKELKPCVLAKNLDCIRKYFPDSVKHEYFDEWYHGYQYPKVSLDDEFLKELEACLDYKHLLPHLLGTRGINKVCRFVIRGDSEIGLDTQILNQEKRKYIFIVSLDYPESVRISGTYLKLYLKGD